MNSCRHCLQLSEPPHFLCKWQSAVLKTKFSLYFTVLSATCKLVCTPNPSLLNDIPFLLFDKSQLIRQEHNKGSKGLRWTFVSVHGCVCEREQAQFCPKFVREETFRKK